LKDILKRFLKYSLKKNNGLRGHVWLLITWLDLYVSIVIACIFQHLKMGLHVLMNNFWEVQKIFNYMFGTRQNENDWLMNLQDKVGLH